MQAVAAPSKPFVVARPSPGAAQCLPRPCCGAFRNCGDPRSHLPIPATIPNFLIAAARRWRQGAAAAAVRPDAFDHEEQPSCAASRRVALVLLAAGAAALSQQPLPAEAANKVARDTGDWSSPGLGAPVDPDAPKCAPPGGPQSC